MRWVKGLLGVSLGLNLVNGVLIALLVTGQWSSVTTLGSSRKQMPADPREIVRLAVLHNSQLTQQFSPHFVQAAYWKKHGDEILSGLEVVEEEQVGNIRAIFYKYSVGTKIFRQVLWLRRLDDSWWITNEYFSTYQDDPFGDGQKDRAHALIKRVDEWQAESAKQFAQ